MTQRTIILQLVAISVVLALPSFAEAEWNSNGSGNGYSKADSLAAGNTPTASVSNRSVTVNWSASGGGVPATGYVVKRYSTGGALQTIGSNCSGMVSGTSCTEDAVPPGNWRYTVTPGRQNWRGNESGQSTAVSVNAPALSLSPNNVTSLPQVLSGSISNYVPGQTVTFRLDDQASGQVLTGSITPSPVPANGNATVSVTLPSGVSNGVHTIYAVGSGSDVASASVNVSVSPTTITTSAYDLDNAVTGIEVATNEPHAFASDGLTQATGTWANSFAAGRHVNYRMNSPLRAGQTVSAANFNFRYAGGSVANPACFYVEVRNGAGTVLSTHGSAASPFGCATSAGQTNFTVPISATVTTTGIANDLVIRVYGRGQTLPVAFTVDRATVTGTSTDGAFELYPNSRTDAAAGGAPISTPWSIFADDDVFADPGGTWPTTYGPANYLKATFPAYVPSGATTINSVTLTHVYRSSTAGRPVCSYFEVLNGNTLIGTHGSSGSDLSCAPTTSDVTDTVSLPEVDTVAEANSLSARIFVRRSGGATSSRHDQVRLAITYTK